MICKPLQIVGKSKILQVFNMDNNITFGKLKNNPDLNNMGEIDPRPAGRPLNIGGRILESRMPPNQLVGWD